MQLAEDLLRPENPLTSRVIVNRLWHHLFGRGIVPTPDNFGQLGIPPSHPQLLDWLARRFVRDGWSIKRMIRLIVTSETWQQSSHAGELARRQDPDNLYLSHANVRRLEAEAVRDSLLVAAGTIDRALGGGPVGGASPRRSVYVRVRRNSLDPLLRVFDFPEPTSAVGRRDQTNVPAQSLLLMNSPQVASYASSLARKVSTDRGLNNDVDRITEMFVRLFTRNPSAEEVRMSLEFLASAPTQSDPANPDRRDAWTALAQTLVTLKELIYVR